MLQLLIDSSILNGNFTLYPIQTRKLLSPNFVYLNSYTNESQIIPYHDLDLECFYRSSSTALNLCDGVVSTNSAMIHNYNIFRDSYTMYSNDINKYLCCFSMGYFIPTKMNTL